VLAGLEQAQLEGAILELDGDSKELHRFVDERTRDRPDLVEANRRRAKAGFRLGPIAFGWNRYLQLPIEGGTLAALRTLLQTHADPEIAIELSVRDDEGYLVEAPDVGYNEIWVSRRLPQHSVEALRAALGDGLRAPKS
jgi:DNA-binding NarL/FixJ family response regulator